jgi:hypothetical protein
MLLIIEQLLNGLQLETMLFLMSAGLTLVLDIMQVINLAHGPLYMIGAYVGATVTARTGSFLLGMAAALAAVAITGMVVETAVLRRLYKKDHLDQVLAIFGLIMFFNEISRIIWRRQPLFMDVPAWLSGTIEIVPGIPYSAYRIAAIGVGIAVGLFLYLISLSSRILIYALGPGETVELSKLIQKLKHDLTILLVEHDMKVVFSLADRITVLVYGAAVASGTPDQIRAIPIPRQAYLSDEGPDAVREPYRHFLGQRPLEKNSQNETANDSAWNHPNRALQIRQSKKYGQGHQEGCSRPTACGYG